MNSSTLLSTSSLLEMILFAIKSSISSDLITSNAEARRTFLKQKHFPLHLVYPNQQL